GRRIRAIGSSASGPVTGRRVLPSLNAIIEATINIIRATRRSTVSFSSKAAISAARCAIDESRLNAGKAASITRNCCCRKAASPLAGPCNPAREITVGRPKLAYILSISGRRAEVHQDAFLTAHFAPVRPLKINSMLVIGTRADPAQKDEKETAETPAIVRLIVNPQQTHYPD